MCTLTVITCAALKVSSFLQVLVHMLRLYFTPENPCLSDTMYPCTHVPFVLANYLTSHIPCLIAHVYLIQYSVTQVDFLQLQMNTLRRYKRHYKLQLKPGTNKIQLVEVRLDPINLRTQFIVYFLNCRQFQSISEQFV